MLKILLVTSLMIVAMANPLLSQKHFDAWIKDYNNDQLKTMLSAHYDEVAYTDYTTGLVTGKGAIAKQLGTLKKLTGQIDKIEIKGITEGRSSTTMINGIIHAENGRFALTSSMRKIDGIFLREYEIIRPYNGSTDSNISRDIDSQRDAWQKHSNEHNPTSLVNNVYSDYPYYLNRGNLLDDAGSIAEEYGYMTNPNWVITLTKKSLIVVNDQLAFEIGKFNSGGEGQYLLIWEKSSTGQWEIILDSNF